jgi:hypothetical protein
VSVVDKVYLFGSVTITAACWLTVLVGLIMLASNELRRPK